MNFYYAIGGGLGHISRARLICNALDIEDTTVIASSSPHLYTQKITGSLSPLHIPVEEAQERTSLKEWLSDQLERLQPEKIFIDTYPGGILGELNDFAFPENSKIIYLARLLNWSKYTSDISASFTKYHETWKLEPLTLEHDRELTDFSYFTKEYKLPDNSCISKPDDDFPRQVREFSEGRKLWLIVHSEPEVELQKLISITQALVSCEEEFPLCVIISPTKPIYTPADMRFVDWVPALDWFPFADRIITGGGFMMMHDAFPFADKHYPVSFQRRYDLQHIRVMRHIRSQQCFPSHEDLVPPSIVK